MSLLLHNVHFVVWSCMEDVVHHNVLRCLFRNHVICRLPFVWGRFKCTNINGFVNRDVSFIFKEREFLFRHHKNLFGCNALFVDDQPSKHIRNKALECCYFLHTWPSPSIIDNTTTSCHLYIEKRIPAQNVPLYLENHSTYGQPQISQMIWAVCDRQFFAKSSKSWNTLIEYFPISL